MKDDEQFELVAIEDELIHWDDAEIYWWSRLGVSDWLVQCLEDRDVNG